MIPGKEVRLRAIEREDIPRFVRWMNDPDVIQFLLMSSPLSTAMEEKWFEKQLERPPYQGQILAIEVLQGQDWAHIGNTDLRDADPVSRTAEFGIVIGEKAFWNKGYGTRATRLMVKHGFENLNLNRIFLTVFANNPRAIKAYQSAGFTQEGILRQGIYKNGRYQDLILMSVLRSDWMNFEDK